MDEFEYFVDNYIPCFFGDEHRLKVLRATLKLLKEQKEELYKLDRENQLMLERIAEQPQIVRCKDCTWWGTDRMCENSDSPCFQNGCTHGDWFCADGEPKEQT